MTEGDDRRGNFLVVQELQPLLPACKPRPEVLLGIRTRFVDQARRRDGAQKIKKIKNLSSVIMYGLNF